MNNCGSFFSLVAALPRCALCGKNDSRGFGKEEFMRVENAK
jgi:hypothetical protein